MAEPLFQAIKLRKNFAGVCAADDLSLAVARGEFRAIIGPNGAGKSTFFNMITGFLTPDSGKIMLEGDDITGRPPHQLFHRGISRTFQITSILADLTVLENVQITLLSCHRRTLDVFSRAGASFVEESDALLDSVGLFALRDTIAKTLSHGDQKRLELAVALANKPRLLLLDEPTAGMTARERIESIRMVHSIAKARNLTVIFTEHDMEVVFSISDQITVMHQGRILVEGTPAHIRDNKEVQTIYLGENTEIAEFVE
jgi:branched-chain amino acid transport system ATP-binding protein